jgi:septal ring factor EnvC (AmiA/AmiB activator)
MTEFDPHVIATNLAALTKNYERDEARSREDRHRLAGEIHKTDLELEVIQERLAQGYKTFEANARQIENISARVTALEARETAQQGGLAVVKWLWAGIGGILMLGADLLIRRWLEK